MAKEINFKKAAREMENKKEADTRRAMIDRMREIEEENPDYDPTESLQNMIAEEDPKLASMMDDYATVSAMATVGRMRQEGFVTGGTDFERVRDRKAIIKEAEIGWKLNKQMHTK